MSENVETSEVENPLSEELISINGRHFHKNTLNEEQLAAFEQAVELSAKIEDKKIEARDLTYARQYLINFIEEGIEGFTEFIPEAVGAEAKAEDVS